MILAYFLNFTLLHSAQLQDMEINEDDDDEDKEEENESESEEPDKQMGDVEDDNQTNEVRLFYTSSFIS